MGDNSESILDELIHNLNAVNSERDMKAAKKIKSINKIVVRAQQRYTSLKNWEASK